MNLILRYTTGIIVYHLGTSCFNDLFNFMHLLEILLAECLCILFIMQRGHFVSKQTVDTNECYTTHLNITSFLLYSELQKNGNNVARQQKPGVIISVLVTKKLFS